MLVLAVAAGVVRLLPWLLAPEVPLRVAIPFAKALAGTALETAALVGPPLGFAAGAARLVERGEARALTALGTSPAGLVARSAGAMLAVLAVAWLACATWNADAGIPGRFAAGLVAQGKASCSGARQPHASLVPIFNVTWLCFPGRPPRVTGALPGMPRGEGWFTASALEPSDDLQRLDLEQLELVTRQHDPAPAVHIKAAHATVRGLPGWGRPDKLGPAMRAALVVVTSLALGLLCALLVVRSSIASRLAALALGGSAALAALSALHAVDRSSSSATWYALVPAAGAAAALVLAAGFSLLARWRVAGRGAR